MKRLVIFLMLIIMVMILGCQSPLLNDPSDPPTQEQGQEDPDVSQAPDENQSSPKFSVESLGRVRLGMSAEEVESILGNDYTQEIHDEGGYFGESIIVRTYADGCDLIIGSNSDRVLQMEAYCDSYPTSMGFRVGDPSMQVMDAYRGKYREFVGRHSSEKLLGWFMIGDTCELLIFSSQENRERFNENIAADSKVTGITLGYSYYFD